MQRQANKNGKESWGVTLRGGHLSQQAIPVHHPKQWQPATLIELLGRIGKLAPGMQVDWSNKVSLRLTYPGHKSFYIRVGTSHAYGIRMGVLCPAGMMTTARVDKLGLSPEISRGRKDTDAVSFWVQRMDQVDTEQFATLIRAAVGDTEPPGRRYDD